MFKKFAIGLLVFFGVSFAAQAADFKIGVVDMQQILQESPQGKQAQDELKKEFGPREQKLQAKQKQLKELADKLQRNGSVMSEAEREETQKKGRDLQRELQMESQALQEDYNQERQDKLGALQQEIVKQVQTYGRDNQFDLILAKGAAVYAGPGADVTAAVLKKMQAAAGK